MIVISPGGGSGRTDQIQNHLDLFHCPWTALSIPQFGGGFGTGMKGIPTSLDSSPSAKRITRVGAVVAV